MAYSLHTFSLLDAVDVAADTGRDLLECAELLYALSAHLDFDHLLTSVTALERGDRWHALARQALRDDLYRSLRLLTADVLSTTSGDQDAHRKIEQWEDENASRLARARRTLGEIAAVSGGDLAAAVGGGPGDPIDDPLSSPVTRARPGADGWVPPVRQTAGRQSAGWSWRERSGERGVSRRYVTQVRVRWSDLDAFRHVNNAKTVTLLEEARIDWLFAEAARHGVDRLTEGIVVARLEIDYKRPIGMELPVTVSMGLTKLGQASMTVDYIVSVAGTTVATALSVLVPVDPVTFRPRRMDDRERAYLTQYLHDPVTTGGG